MQRLDKIKEVKVAEQSIEVDPRSKTSIEEETILLKVIALTLEEQKRLEKKRNL